MTARSLSKQAASKKPSKSKKPIPDFPLYAHASDEWCKEIRGKAHFFGSWAIPDIQRKETIAVVEAVEVSTLLIAVDGVIGRVVVEDDFFGRLVVAVDEGVDEDLV